MTYEEIVVRVADAYGLDSSLVDRTYKAYWKVIREHVTALPLKEDLTDEEFLKLQPNVNIPSIGKLYVTLDRYKRLKKQFKNYKEIQAEQQQTKEQTDSL